MKIILEIDCDNDGFRIRGMEEDDTAVCGRELEYIFSSLATKFGESNWAMGDRRVIFDSSGNKVGNWKFDDRPH